MTHQSIRLRSGEGAQSRRGNEPPLKSLRKVRQIAATCERCPLYEKATQIVFGEGPAHARVMLVGEQPGDQEDREGKPFVGPAGRILDRAMEDAKVDRSQVYLTNAVKHFKFEERGKRRLHKRPDAYEIERCKWWLEKEMKLVAPTLVVALGATAARALLGRATIISKVRGKFRPIDNQAGVEIFVTVHPSSLLRAPDKKTRKREYKRFVADLASIGRHVPALRASR